MEESYRINLKIYLLTLYKWQLANFLSKILWAIKANNKGSLATWIDISVVSL